MAYTHPDPPGSMLPPAPPRREGKEEFRAFLRAAVPFVVLGLAIYLALFAGSEWLVYRYGNQNQFFQIRTAEEEHFDHVILGASHAAVFDYRDMNERLEAVTGTRIINLAEVGAGITVNRLLLDYFLRDHSAENVVYIVDSFAFYSPEWNEERLQDPELYLRAPWDPELALSLAAVSDGWSTALDHLFGFSKINNPDRLEPDVFEAEGSRFERSYRPIAQIDRQRMEYLYPSEIDERSLLESPYLAEFEELIESAKERGMGFTLIRPPVPERIQQLIPLEKRFAEVMDSVARVHGVEYHDFSSVNNDEEWFYDSDHLNREGALRFIDRYLEEVLAAE